MRIERNVLLNATVVVVALLCLPILAFGQQTSSTKRELAGKVSSLLPRTRTPELSGRKRDFRRLINDDEQHDRIMKELSEPMSHEARCELHEARLNRYGSSATSMRTTLTDFGLMYEEGCKPKPQLSAKEPEEDSSNLAVYVLLGIFSGSMFFIFKARS